MEFKGTLEEKKKSLERLRRLNYIKAEKELAHFAKLSWKVLEADTPILWNWHHDLICEYLTACKIGQIKRLVINEPPRMMKSLLVTVNFPVWAWVTQPQKRFIFGSHAATLANKHSLLRRDLIESPWYQKGWADRFVMASDQNMKSDFKNNKTGQMFAAGISGSVTGEGGDFIVIDDALNPKDADSDAERQSVLDSFDLVWSSRLNNKKEGVIIIVEQRVHHRDLSGHVLAKELGYEHLCLPAECEKKTIIVFPLSKQNKIREEGDILHPEREGKVEIERAKKDLGTYGFAGQYQQRPSPKSGGIIKRAWLKNFWRAAPERLDVQIQSWDFAFKATAGSSNVCGTVWGKRGGEFFLLDLISDKLEFTESLTAVKTMSAKHPRALAKLVEAKANGPAVMSVLKTKVPGMIPYDPDTSKEARLSAVSPLFEAGNIWLPDPELCPWVHDYIEELVSFPNAPQSDRVDSTSQALLHLTQAMGEFTDEIADAPNTSNIDFGRDTDGW